VRRAGQRLGGVFDGGHHLFVGGLLRQGHGDFSARVTDDGRTDEVGALISAFNTMADSLETSEERRNAFIANVSHELKTPMTTIAGYTDGILDGTIPPEKERQYLQIISDESRRLSRLVRRMLDISQIQNQEMRKEEFDLCESARIALLSMEQKIMSRGLDVDAEIPEDSVMVQGDRDLITQVMYNLLENAAKFAAPASPWPARRSRRRCLSPASARQSCRRRRHGWPAPSP